MQIRHHIVNILVNMLFKVICSKLPVLKYICGMPKQSCQALLSSFRLLLNVKLH